MTKKSKATHLEVKGFGAKLSKSSPAKKVQLNPKIKKNKEEDRKLDKEITALTSDLEAKASASSQNIEDIKDLLIKRLSNFKEEGLEKWESFKNELNIEKELLEKKFKKK